MKSWDVGRAKVPSLLRHTNVVAMIRKMDMLEEVNAQCLVHSFVVLCELREDVIESDGFIR